MGTVSHIKTRRHESLDALQTFLTDKKPDTGICVLHAADGWYTFLVYGPQSVAEMIGAIEASKHDLIESWE